MKKQILCCDNCDKEQVIETGEFPYSKGWCYLYKFNAQFKTSTKSNKYQRLEKEDKHFCSKKCMIEYLKETIKEK